MELFWKNNYAIGLLVMEAILCTTFPRKEKAMIKWIACTMIIFIISTVSMQTWEWKGETIAIGNIISNVLSCILIAVLSIGQLYLCFEISVWNGVFLAFIADTCQGLVFSVYKVAESVLLGEIGTATPGIQSVLLNFGLLLLGCMLLFRAVGIKKCLQIHSSKREKQIIILSAILQVFNKFFNRYLFATDPYVHMGTTMIVFRLYVIMFELITLYMLYNLIARYALEIEQTAIEAIVRQRNAQYAFSQELMDTINIKSHDLKKQIKYLRREDTDREDLLQELETLTDSFDTTVHSSNEALNTVLSEKGMICYRNSIQFSFIANGEGLDFMRDLDIYTLFANLLDNAIEASQLLPPENRSIQIVVKRQEGFLSIHAENYFNGTVHEQDGQLLTIKADKQYHGFGVRSMRQIVEFYDGSITFKTDGNIFKVNILLPIPESAKI